MSDKTPSSLIINSPYEKPARYWDQDENGKLLTVTQGRRPAAYELYDTRTNTRRIEKLELVNAIRERVDAWRDAGWPGVTSVTRQLLEHWFDRGEWDGEGKCWIGGPRQYPFYFCQLEAIESLIWWLEAPQDHKQGIFLQGDGGPWERICSKMATGSGKTPLDGVDYHLANLECAALPQRYAFFQGGVHRGAGADGKKPFAGVVSR